MDSTLVGCNATYNLTPGNKDKVAQTCLGGWDSRVAYVKKFREEVGTENVLLLDTGDVLSGTHMIYQFLRERSRGREMEARKERFSLKKPAIARAFIGATHRFLGPRSFDEAV